MKIPWGIRGCVAGLAVWMAVASAARGETRIVAIADVHGDYADFVAILQKAGLIDAGRHWSGGADTFVQTGDIPDRGPQSRPAFDLLMELETEAPKQGGRVVPLLGNHEVMNMIGDIRYVSAEEYQSYSNDQSAKVRDEAYQDFLKFYAVHRRHQHSMPGDDEAGREKWMASHPLGYFEQRDAFGPHGVYGRWLRTHDAVAQVGDVIFLHGGLDPKLHFKNLRELNERVRAELQKYDSLWERLSKKRVIWRYMTLTEALHQISEEWREAQAGNALVDPVTKNEMEELMGIPQWLIMTPDGPLWYRGLALEPEEKLRGDFDKMMEKLKAHYLVAGHTVRPKFNVTAHFDNRVFLIDTGMLKPYFGGRASALEIVNGRFTAHYADGSEQVLLGPGGAAVPAAEHGDPRDPARP